MLLVYFGTYIWAADDDRAIKPDLRLQAEFNNITSSEKGEGALSSDISKLKEETKSMEYILQQIVYFRANAKKMYLEKKVTSAQMDRVTGASYIILNGFLDWDASSRKLSSVSANHIIDAVVPYLETKDPELRKQLLWLLNLIDYRGILKVDYSEYELYIKSKKDNPPQTLIQYMYERLPGEALLTLMRIYMKEAEVREFIAHAEQVVDNDIRKRYYGPLESRSKVDSEAIEALNKLSRNDQWWVRLYVAEIIGREPALRSPEIIDRLKKDTNPLVHETLKRFQIE
jgi:hypothetical protein